MSLAPLQEAQRLTEAMLNLAKEGEWDGVPELEKARQRCLAGLQLAGMDEATEQAAIDLLRAIQAMNRELVDLSEQERSRVREALLSLRKGDRARRAYR